MLDLSTIVTVDSPFVPYSPASCSLIPRDVCDVYELVPGDHIAVRWHKPVKGERDEDVMWVWCRITAVKEHTKLIALFDLNHHETMLCPITKQDTNNTHGFKLRSSKKHLSSWCAFRVLVENEDLPLFKPANALYQHPLMPAPTHVRIPIMTMNQTKRRLATRIWKTMIGHSISSLLPRTISVSIALVIVNFRSQLVLEFGIDFKFLYSIIRYMTFHSCVMRNRRISFALAIRQTSCKVRIQGSHTSSACPS